MRAVISVLLVLALAQPLAAQVYDTVHDRYPAQSLVEDIQGGLGAASPTNARSLPAIAIKLIKTFEGWSSIPYNDAVGYCTIGYGHLIALTPCTQNNTISYRPPISISDGEAILEKDTISARLIVQELVTKELNSEQFGALSSFVFNIGKGNFAKSSMLRLLNSGDFDIAAEEFERWVKAGGTVLQGLVFRRACERLLFIGKLRLNQRGEIDREACGSLGIAPSNTQIIDVNKGEF